jgi:hypothetical protein
MKLTDQIVPPSCGLGRYRVRPVTASVPFRDSGDRAELGHTQETKKSSQPVSNQEQLRYTPCVILFRHSAVGDVNRLLGETSAPKVLHQDRCETPYLINYSGFH